MAKVIHISGRRWFQKSYGNTYHSVTVHIDGEPVFSSGKHYGYGDQYQQTAWDWLDKHILGDHPDIGSPILPERLHYENGASEPPWQWSERVGIKVVNEVSDVARERDL